MSDRNDFLQTILAAPEDDAPRLIFADWLEEQGETERAEFIRIQCELAQSAEGDPRRKRLRAREQELLRLYQVAWREQLPELEEVRWETFERGFVSAVRVESRAAFETQAKTIFEAAPIRELRFHRIYQDGARKIALSAYLQKVRILDLEDGNAIGNVGLEALAGSPYIRELNEMKLRSNAIGPAGVRALARSKYLESLTDLSLDHNALFDEGVEAIAESPRFRQLKQLSLGWTECGDRALMALARAKHLATLNWLYLSGNQISDDGLIALADSEILTSLRALYMEANRIGDRGVEALARSKTLANLVWIYLKSNRITDEGAMALVNSEHLQKTEELVLIENLVGPETIQLLRQRFGQRVWCW